MSKTSTKPKGATSYKETSFGIIPRSKLLQLEVEGTKKGLEFIAEWVKKNKQAKITPEFICKLHEVAYGWIFPDWAGKYRKIQVTFSGKEAPSYFQISELIHTLCEDLAERLKHLPKADQENYSIEIIKLLAWFQHRFVFIHPFQDYNGRTARMPTSLILLQKNLPTIEIKVAKSSNRKQYLQAMQNADQGNYTLFEEIISQSLTEALETITK